ncbi:xanthine dehydrogenase accessory factor [Streptomyces sulfonofaciens]|uniref:Xanthine dehydrogenase accessory factor n=1 Tax=Streptomyces sulfonofaciens TaxID=68272 RepID=A0A919GL92_9ACTN|nr:XdhC/CoxI family protein [Streptomyces sulfonofaciens]GHH86056.1 xanthine dehydrogenase accessory factor [Streptomyces sulfonofaciens]
MSGVVMEEMERWWRAGAPFACATVVETWHSSPQPPGARMLVGPDGTVVGSVSGGCVEGAVYDLGQEVIASGTPVLQRYGVSDEDAFAVGLTCGGVLDVYLERIDPAAFPGLDAVAASVRDGEPVAVVTCVAAAAPAGTRGEADTGQDPAGRLGRRLVVRADRTEGSLGTDLLDRAAVEAARGMLAEGRSGTLRCGYDGRTRGDDLTLFVSAHAAPPRMIVFGAIDFAAAAVRMGRFLGYRVTVCDARPVFATARRFPDAAEVVTDWPHRYLRAEAEAGRVDERTVVCVLTHDPKFDVPLLEVALRLPLAYVGAMGSRRTHEDRLARLREAGLGEPELSRLSSPIGLDLGARTPEETAVSIAAEIVATRWGGSGERLTSRTGRIHDGP